MASMVGSAPAAERPLVEDPEFLTLVQRCLGLTHKLLDAVQKTHKCSVDTETFHLNSSDNGNLATVAHDINMPTFPVLQISGENLSLERGLTKMAEGLPLYQALLNAVSSKLEKNEKVKALTADIRDLVIVIHKMLKKVNTGHTVQPTPTPVELRLDDEYKVQVATHLTLVHLQSFGRDMIRWLRKLDPNEEEEDTKSG